MKNLRIIFTLIVLSIMMISCQEAEITKLEDIIERNGGTLKVFNKHRMDNNDLIIEALITLSNGDAKNEIFVITDSGVKTFDRYYNENIPKDWRAGFDWANSIPIWAQR